MINVLNYLEETVDKYPNKVAIVDKNEEITFGDLDEYSTRIASYLYCRLETINRPIFVSVDRTNRPIVSFMSVLKSGNFYVPIDEKTPRDRLKHMIDTVKPAAYIHFGQRYSLKQVEGLMDEKDLIDYKQALEEGELRDLSSIREKILDVDPCYLLFTSGSTGSPKGVVISHRGVIDLTDWLGTTLDTKSTDVIGNQTPFFFDASTKDLYQMLSRGASLHILNTQLFMFPKLLVEYLNEHKVTMILWATSAISIVANSGILESDFPRYLRTITFAGEQLYARQLNVWKALLPEVEMFNLYGPTEATVDSSFYKVERAFEDDEIIPIGKACLNKELLLLDEDDKLIDRGVGELAIRGSGVALGYYNDLEKTKKVFIQNPRHNLYRDPIYKTGDIVEKLEDGNFVFLSRKDNQIKLQGHRIELGEIDKAIYSLENIEECLTIYIEDQEKIVSYYTGKEEKPTAIMKKLGKKIPKYMVPHEYIYLEEMPYTRNGKIDRIRLEGDYAGKN